MSRPPNDSPPKKNVIRELRMRAKLTQQELGERVGLTGAAVSRHENHQRNISKAYVTRYEKELGGCWRQP